MPWGEKKSTGRQPDSNSTQHIALRDAHRLQNETKDTQQAPGFLAPTRTRYRTRKVRCERNGQSTVMHISIGRTVSTTSVSEANQNDSTSATLITAILNATILNRPS